MEYDDRGAMGLVINRPTNLALSMVLPAVEELEQSADTVFIGGPVAQDRVVLLIRAQDQPEESKHVFDNVYVSASRLALREILQKANSGQSFHAYVGYAGWAPGQLEGEVARGDWILSSANVATLFDSEASDVWPELIRRNSGLWVRGIELWLAQSAAESIEANSEHRWSGASWVLASADSSAY